MLLGSTIEVDGQDDAAGVYLHLYPSDEIGHLIGQNPKPTPRPGSREENEKHKGFVLA